MLRVVEIHPRTPDAIDIYGWVNAGTGYKYWISGNVNFEEAQKLCKKKNGSLATVGIRNKEVKE